MTLEAIRTLGWVLLGGLLGVAFFVGWALLRERHDRGGRHR